jgi:DNA replication protein DnaC
MTYDIRQLEYMQRHWIKDGANIPSRFIGMEPSDIVIKKGIFPQDIEDFIADVLAGDVIQKQGGLGTTGVGLLFDGDPGLGKTTHAVVTLMELVRRLPSETDEIRRIFNYKGDNLGAQSRPVYYLTYPEFLSRKKAMFDADPDVKKAMYLEMEGFHGRAKEDWMNVRILVLDDLGKEYGSKYDDTSFDEILRSRYDKGLPTIVTTNVEREKWKTKYGAAMGSFVYEAFNRVEVTGKDLRK